MEKITVLCTVYNGERYFDRAIPSILNQTFSNFDFLIINDGSTDNTAKMLDEVAKKDNRIKVIHCERMGRVNALNYGISLATTSLIANQDFDDISYELRLEKQVAFMISEPEIVWCGTACLAKNEQRNECYPNNFHLKHAKIIKSMAHSIPFDHTTVMFRKEPVIKVGGYPNFGGIEDLRMSIKLAKYGYKLANLPDILGEHNEHTQSYWNSTFNYRTRQMALQKAQFQAIKELKLPYWMYIYPLGRYFYFWLPNPLKKIIRRILLNGKIKGSTI